jgi:hypothetical protein
LYSNKSELYIKGESSHKLESHVVQVAADSNLLHEVTLTFPSTDETQCGNEVARILRNKQIKDTHTAEIKLLINTYNNQYTFIVLFKIIYIVLNAPVLEACTI